jgi:hypothetical protein
MNETFFHPVMRCYQIKKMHHLILIDRTALSNMLLIHGRACYLEWSKIASPFGTFMAQSAHSLKCSKHA